MRHKAFNFQQIKPYVIYSTPLKFCEIEEQKMCTLMQKDALIERVASVQALIARKTPRTGKRTADQNRIVEVRRLLYDSLPEEIDFQAIADECYALHQKYSALPKPNPTL